jgi:hypothetical protein
MLDNEVTMEVDNFGNKRWRNKNGELHRLDGPAFEGANGGKYWYLNGVLHREGGPAVERVNGDKEWWLNGVLHREGGPAVELASGYKRWYLNGIQYKTKESYFDALSYEVKRLCLISEDFLNA